MHGGDQRMCCPRPSLHSPVLYLTFSILVVATAACEHARE